MGIDIAATTLQTARPRLLPVLKERGHLFLPLIIIVGVLMSGYSAPFAALFGILSIERWRTQSKFGKDIPQ